VTRGTFKRLFVFYLEDPAFHVRDEVRLEMADIERDRHLAFVANSNLDTPESKAAVKKYRQDMEAKELAENAKKEASLAAQKYRKDTHGLLMKYKEKTAKAASKAKDEKTVVKTSVDCKSYFLVLFNFNDALSYSLA